METEKSLYHEHQRSSRWVWGGSGEVERYLPFFQVASEFVKKTVRKILKSIFAFNLKDGEPATEVLKLVPEMTGVERPHMICSN